MKPITKQIEIKEGFYPTFIYLLPTQAIINEPYVQDIRQILTQASVQFREVEELHLSLSRTFYPIYTEIQTIVNRCKSAIKAKQISLPIVLLFKKVKVLQNFITLEVQQVTSDRLIPITREVEKIVSQAFYDSPIFHVSLFKIESEITPQVLQTILSVQISPKKSFIMTKCLMRCGKVTYELNP